MAEHLDLLKLCKEGDAKGQRMLYELFSGRLMGLCRRYTRRREEAQDVLQESFIRIFLSIHQLESSEKIEPWMKTIVVNTAINHYHRTKKKDDLFISLSGNQVPESAEPLVELKSFSDDYLVGLINELPDGCRVIFNLFAIEGYSHAEIAEFLKITQSTSRSQYHYAKSLLKTKLNCQDLTRYYEKFA